MANIVRIPGPALVDSDRLGLPSSGCVWIVMLGRRTIARLAGSHCRDLPHLHEIAIDSASRSERFPLFGARQLRATEVRRNWYPKSHPGHGT